MCYVVATPIGNLRDMTLRALDVLASVAIIYAEDTRHSKTLLAQYNIRTPLRSLHEHNEQTQTQGLIHELQHGSSIAIISDAGTPLISDPGYKAISQMVQVGIKIVPIPGACAAVAALSAAGLATDCFLFKGFLPVKSSARQGVLSALSREPSTLIFYEAKHRLLDMLNDLSEVLGVTRQLVLGRELTKKFETFYRGSLGEVIEQVQSSVDAQKGEFVVLVEGYQEKSEDILSALNSISVEAFIKLMRTHVPDKHIAQALAKLTTQSKRDWYAYLIEDKHYLPDD